MKELFELISTLGFPIVISGYLLFRMEKKMDDLVNLITKDDGIADKIKEIAKTVDNCCKGK